MALVSRTIATGLLGLTLASCSAKDIYPPALPDMSTRQMVIPWDNSEPFLPPPPPELRYKPTVATMTPASQLMPGSDEWAQWRAYTPPQTVCTGKGRRKKCTKVQATAVDQANTTAVVKPRAVHTAYGQSIQVRYPYDGRGQKVYEITTSPGEFTRLILPPRNA